MNETGKRGYIRTETVPTQAQIEAARKVLRNSSCFCDEVCSLLPCKCVEAALTAAKEADVPEQEHILQKPGQKPDLLPSGNIAAEEGNTLSHADKVLWNETIERCAQVAESTTYMSGAHIAAAIRALKDKT